VNRNFVSFGITDPSLYKQKMLSWANQFNIFCFMDNNYYQLPNGTYECVLAAGAAKSISLQSGFALPALKQFHQQNGGWLFGYFGYDLKNELYQLHSHNADNIQLPDLHFFVPQTIILLNKNEIAISSLDNNAEKILQTLHALTITNKKLQQQVTFSSRFSKQQYIDVVNKLKTHIQKGDCYEINFCQEFFAEHVNINPLQTYNALTKISPNPFATCYKLNDKWLLCASPERYLKKQGNKIISQPIKGTAKRDVNNSVNDELSKQQLLYSAKERSENVMVVDIVRNDLSMICEEGTVKVDELFGLYSFPQVHQMISTISGLIKNNVHWVDAIAATFPMGSMTGAPKLKVMQLIEQYEKTKRGLFSGAVGYVTAENNFDFNVVIRSLLYNQTSQYLSYQVGSGITFYCDAASEYNECVIKAEAIKNIFEH
jgi:para-aminobenzoate synthetase component I